MCWSRNSKTLSWLGIIWGVLSFTTLLTAFLSNGWLYTKEPVHFPKTDMLTIVTFKIGLWETCPTIKRTNATSPVPLHSCTPVKYSPWEDITSTDLGIPTPLEFTPLFLSKMRISTLFGGLSLIFIFLATGSALLGLYNNDHKTLIACGLFILGGLTLGGGLLIFASVLSDAYFERPKRSHVIIDASNKMTSSGLFDYKYGWSFFAAGAAFFMAELAAVLSISAYVRRFPTVEEMVRIMVPGAERRLKERHGFPGECLVQHKTKHQRPDTAMSLSSSLKSKSDVMNTGDFRRPEEEMFMNKPAPDICTSNPASKIENIISFTSPSVSSELLAMPGNVYCTKSDEMGPISHTVLSSSPKRRPLAGQTVPIVLMHHPQKPSGASFLLPVSNMNVSTNYTVSNVPLFENSGKCDKVSFPPNYPGFNDSQMTDFDKSFYLTQGNDIDNHFNENEKFSFGFKHASSELEVDAGNSFETFHGEKSCHADFIDPSTNVPGTFSSTSSSSGVSGPLRETTQSCLVKNKVSTLPHKKKRVTIGSVFSTMEPPRTNRSDSDSTEKKIGV